VTLLCWAPGDGFACLTLVPGSQGWSLTVTFDREQAAPQPIVLALT
jgi:hypothetical protein